MKRSKSTSAAYSTDPARRCPGCLRPLGDCVCRNGSRPSGGGARSASGVIVQRATKGRKGRGVTLIKGLPLSAADLQALAKQLKSTCGVGGSVKNDVIELQGDQRQTVQSLLQAQGFSVKLSGG